MQWQKQTQSMTGNGPGLLTLLTVLFVGLKLTEEIDWAWKWVLAPAWIPAAIIAVLLVGLGALKFGLWAVERRARSKRIARREAARRGAGS